MRGKRVMAWLLAALIVAVVTGVPGWCARTLGKFGAVEWPPVADPAALRREGTALCRGAGGWHELQPAQYPPAVTALHPASVSMSGERMYVELVPVAGGRTRFHGYSVWPGTADRADGGITREESDGK